jgi:hypothetical protein
MSATQPDASSYPGGTRPTLGSSLGAILAGWCRATRSVSGSQRVRALAFHNPETREYRWNQRVIHRVFTNGESHPATTGDLDQLARAISYGWFLVYLQAGEGQEAIVLHQPGKRVPSQSIQPQGLALLLREYELPPGNATLSPRVEPERTAALEREGTLPTPSPSALQEPRTANLPASLPPEGRSSRKARWPLAALTIGGESTLLLATVLVLTRNPWYCLGTLGFLAVILLFLRRVCRSRARAEEGRARSQSPSTNN